MTRRWATRLLADLKAGKPFIRTYPLPVQAWQFGGQQLLITLGGEPVVDWALKFKQEFGPQTWVAGYCNDVMNYIPSLRVLKEDMPPLAQGALGLRRRSRDGGLWVARIALGGGCGGLG